MVEFLEILNYVSCKIYGFVYRFNTTCASHACFVLTTKLASIVLVVFRSNCRTHEDHIIKIIPEFNVVDSHDHLINRKFNLLRLMMLPQIQQSNSGLLDLKLLQVWQHCDLQLDHISSINIHCLKANLIIGDYRYQG